MNCAAIKQAITIDDYLARIGLQPAKVTAKGIWYFSPISGEAHPSFEVSPDGTMFHDWSSGASGDLIKLVIDMHPGYSVHDVIVDVTNMLGASNASASPKTTNKTTNLCQKEVTYKEGLHILNSSREICRKLQGYAFGRGITRDILGQYCQEVEYYNAGRTWYSLGFLNDKGGYEIRSHRFKGASAPKGITTIGVNRDCPYLIFEGFFDFLSAVQLRWFSAERNNAIVLNSTAMVAECLDKLQDASRIVCFLDRDESGVKTYQKIAEAFPRAED